MDDDVELIGVYSGVTTCRDCTGFTLKEPRGCLTMNTVVLIGLVRRECLGGG